MMTHLGTLPERPTGPDATSRPKLRAVTATPALLLAAGGVGFGHAILPDHWVPLAVVGRTQRYSLAKVARLSGLAGVAHVLVSLVLGAVIIGIGLQFRSSVEHIQNAIVGSLLIATGAGFAIFELAGRGHTHPHPPHDPNPDPNPNPNPGHDHDHDHDHDEHDEHDHDGHAHAAHHDHGPGRRSALAVMVPFGAAASPDLTILPVFLAAATAGSGAAVGALLVFAVVTITTIVSLTLLATAGGYQIGGQWLERWGNAFTAAILVAIGILVLAGVL